MNLWAFLIIIYVIILIINIRICDLLCCFPCKQINYLFSLFVPDRTVFLWEAKDLANKDRKSLRVNVEFDYATHVKWSPDCKAFVIHRYNENCLEVYKVDKKKDGWLTATKASTFPKVSMSCMTFKTINLCKIYLCLCSSKTQGGFWLTSQSAFIYRDTS